MIIHSHRGDNFDVRYLIGRPGLLHYGVDEFFGLTPRVLVLRWLLRSQHLLLLLKLIYVV